MKRLKQALVGGVIVATIVFAFLAYSLAREHSNNRVAHEAELRLAAVVESFKTAIDRVDGIPNLVGSSTFVEAVLGNPKAESAQRSANEFLSRISKENDVEALFILDEQGVAIAASNYAHPITYIGKNYAFRPYFQAAQADGRAAYYGVGATTGKPGFFLSVKVPAGTDGFGVVVVKVSFSKLEQSWKKSGERVLVSDQEGVVFLSDDDQMRYRAIAEISPSIQHLIASERRYAGFPLGSVIDFFKDLPNGTVVSSALEGTPWKISLLVPAPSPISRPKSAAITVLLLGTLVLSALIIGTQIRERRSADRKKSIELEEQVETRTRDLVKAMEQLEEGVIARRISEQRLAEARDELFQAGKLASMGQAFAGLAHEINQPLAALRTYISSTKLLIERNDFETPVLNLRIMDTTVERLAKLTHDLKHLSRRSDDQACEVDLSESARRIVDLMKFRISDIGAVLHEDYGTMVKVFADSARIDQIVLNLLKNAVDAASEVTHREIKVIVRAADEKAILSIGDTGAGIPDTARTRLFEPFYTTKGVGKGLGLGLAISYTIARDYNGALTYERSKDGETWFHLILPQRLIDTDMEQPD